MKFEGMTASEWAAKQIAPPGQIYVCGACGKTARDRVQGTGGSRGWDESCFLNSILCWERGDDEPMWTPVEAGDLQPDVPSTVN